MKRVPTRFLTGGDKVLPGVRKLQAVQQPAAGSEWVATVPGGRMWRVLGGHATLNTSAAVANRNAGLLIICDGVEVQLNANTNNLTATAAWPIIYQPGTALLGTPNFAFRQILTFQPYWLEQGDQMKSLTGALDVGDQYSNVNLLIEELWLTNQELYEREHEESELLEHVLGGQQR